MKICPKCNSQLTDTAAFCSKCGANLSSYQDIPKSRPAAAGNASRRMHCPDCKSIEITPIIENVGSIGGVGRMTKNIAVTSTSNITKSYWICHGCGHKFENIDDLEAQISTGKRDQKRLHGMLVPLGLFTLFLIVIKICYHSDPVLNFVYNAAFIFMLIFDAFFYAVWKITSKQTKQLEERCAYLKQHCFD